ncbi:hypothetical protein B0J13DRAFT_481032 [Dactylonectria estremocensis]|uniref:[histone H3]-trimethyl-L-lysine(9) demethylase n=1 Tax=Dactylonectria estremocensis TaxID=1079267 RepID=A0A9P9ITZ6_9HYPO|nr:hypothetical protein B0J13DRAFT_481032 [Dactylonectria estremocensis]
MSTSTSTDAAGPAVAAAPPAPPVDDSIATLTRDEIDSANQLQAEAKAQAEKLAEAQAHAQTTFLHSPPDTNKTIKSDASDSELSELDEEPILSDALVPPPASDDGQDDIGEVLPDHWSGTVPVFKPTMDQFKDFKRFMEAVDSYGMKSGIIKIIPPQEWKESLPELDELVKQVKVREPIKQEIMGSSGTYRQVNLLHGRSYNVPQWRQLCDQSEHQPPARRGERRANADKVRPTRSRAAAPKPVTLGTPKKRTRGRPPKNKQGAKEKLIKEETEGEGGEGRPMTPVSPKHETEENEKPVDSIEKDPGEVVDVPDCAPAVGRMGISRQARPKTQSTSARRKYSRREGSAMIDEAAFKDWDYRMDISEYTPERCEELERVYWKTLTYAPPLYGADLMGSLFGDSTDIWNLNKLPNLLDVLGTKVPGVNTAYLYLGMWKATFAWHLEDVDLYSINYLHFGAPKQWYSISQADARRFEAAMKSIWPQDAKACDQFLRHKAFLISPQHLLQHYGIKVNKCVSYPGEFVVTYPYGYHSGYNLGYNCAEAVNFALDSWLDMGKIAKKCECAQAQDSVWVNVYEIERKLRGEETEYEETEEEEEDEEDEEHSGLPTPPASHGVKFKEAGRKRKRGPGEKGGKIKVKKIKLRIKTKAEPPCCLCPNDYPSAEFLPTDDGRRAHRLCALYLPETYIDTIDDKEVVSNVAHIHKGRLDLKCLFCRSKRGACFQCSQKKCARAYHATCAAAAGVFVEDQEVPVFGEDGKEYKEQTFEFSCRFHRTKRDRKVDADALEADPRIQAAAATLAKGDVCQLQFLKGEIFAGCVVENRADEQTLLLDILPNGDRLEVEWKWLLLPHPDDYRLPQASANAIPMPTSRKAKDKLKVTRQQDEKPRKDDVFSEGYTWSEFNIQDVSNIHQAKVDFSKQNQIWYYLGKTSTEAKAQYTEDVSRQRHNPMGNFLDTIPKPPRPHKPEPAAHIQQQQTYAPVGSYASPYSTVGAVGTVSVTPSTSNSVRPTKPYVYKPRKPVPATVSGMGVFTAQHFKPTTPSTPTPTAQVSRPAYPQHQYVQNPGHQHQNAGQFQAQRFDVKTPQTYMPRTNASNLPPTAQTQARPLQHQWQPHIAAPGPVTPQHAQYIPSPMQQQQQRAVAQPKSQVRTPWQVHSSIYQKYQFFQVNHNRDSSKYRTPYSPWGGFTNGYEGNLRAHLMTNQNELLRGTSLITGAQRQPSHATPYGTASLTYAPAPGVHHQPAAPQATPYRANPFSHVPRSAGPTAHPQVTAHPPVDAVPHHHGRASIKAQYLGSPQLSQQMVQQVKPQPAPQLSKPKPAPVPAQKVYRMPPKESPVPLPANFLAAMTSSPKTTKSSPTQTVPGDTIKVSTTPIPIPQLPGMMNSSGPMTQVSARLPATSLPASSQGQGKVSENHTGQPAQTTHQTKDQPLAEASSTDAPFAPQGFPDVPGCESMEFVERLMQNLRKVSQQNGPA